MAFCGFTSANIIVHRTVFTYSMDRAENNEKQETLKTYLYFNPLQFSDGPS